jgi:hypothetical protein
MPTIISGTSTERIVRAAVAMFLVDAFTVAYLWDGYVGYARQNAASFVRVLGLNADAPPAVNPRVTAAMGQRIAASAKHGDPFGDFHATLGEATHRTGDDVYYLGRGGWLHVRASGGRVAAATWTPGERSESDQQWQRWIAYSLAVLGLVLTVHCARVVATRATLNDAGLRLGSGPLIPFDAMRGLRQDALRRAGCVELEYTVDGRTRSMRLEKYVYRELPALVTAICERRGFAAPSARRG